MFPEKKSTQEKQEGKLSDDIPSKGQQSLIEAISSYASLSFSQSSTLHKIFEETIDEELLEQPSKQSSIKQIVLKYALDDKDLLNEIPHKTKRKTNRYSQTGPVSTFHILFLPL